MSYNYLVTKPHKPISQRNKIQNTDYFLATSQLRPSYFPNFMFRVVLTSHTGPWQVLQPPPYSTAFLLVLPSGLYSCTPSQFLSMIPNPNDVLASAWSEIGCLRLLYQPRKILGMARCKLVDINAFGITLKKCNQTGGRQLKVFSV